MVTIPRNIIFKPTRIENYESSNGRCMQSQDYIKFDGDFNGTRRVVSSITISLQNLSAYLNTDVNPSTPYVPQYPGSPTTKQYVDQHDTIVSATAPSNPTEGMVWYDSTNDILKTYDGANWNEAGTQMVVLSYGNSTWNDFITAYADNAVVYCRASSNSNPATGTQGRMAFMAYVNNATNPTEVEFQYYRSRSDHNSAANQLDQVFVYKLTSASGGTWTVTERNTAAKAVAGTGINLAFGSGNMTISNTGVTSVNGDTGVVTVNDVKVSAAEPSPHTEGTVWYDTTNDQLKVYDGSQWNITGKEYNAGEGIEIGTVQDYSAIQGPCPNGFHVPMRDELTTLYSYMNTLGLTDTGGNFKEKLLLPNASKLAQNTGQRESYSTYAYLRSCNSYNTFGARTIQISNSTIYHGNSDFNSKSGGDTIRPFKDTSVSPDSSWTALYDGSSVAAGAGVFHNESLGLISVSSDGINWITLADKNLGATVAYNVGDTLSEANCGKFYQWGNNYGFPWTGATTTSSTKVDASNYGPGNYYSSSTFIIAENASSSTAWDTTNNPNLRGGETGVVTLDNAINNKGVLSVNGQTGDVTIATPEESNTKTFYLSSTSDLTNAQAALDWYLAGKNPIIVYNRFLYFFVESWTSDSASYLNIGFVRVNGDLTRYSSTSFYSEPTLIIKANNTTQIVSEISLDSQISGRTNSMSFLETSRNYSTPYTPQYDGSPTTKKYVDDRDTYIGSSAPTSNLVEGRLWYDTTNDQLKVYDGSQWNEVSGGDVKVFEVPAVNDDISDMVTRLSAGKGVILHEMVSGTDAFYKVDYHDDVTQEITASLLYSYNGGYARYYTIVYNYSTKKVSTKTSSLTYFFAPETAGTQGQVLTKTNSGYEWAAPQGTTYNAGEGIEIGTIQDYSAMRGPAPSGFHVPSKDEWVTLCGILTTTFGLVSNATTMGTYLKMPMDGRRLSSSADVNGQDTSGSYWSSSSYNTSEAYILGFNSLAINPQSSYGRANGLPIRCFKDTPTVPTSSWTMLYDGSSVASGAGVFSNSTDGLISLSGDGTTWYTIMDKNLGATTVFNQGDTLTDANCGYYYQRGNNYGFAHSGAVTTSSTKVDASNYGPGNYYNSSTFITASASPYDWSSVQNDDLWGGETGVVTLENAVTNTGVLSVNGQSGDITIPISDIKLFEMTETAGATQTQQAQDIIDRINGGNNIRTAVISYGTSKFKYYGDNIIGPTNSQQYLFRHCPIVYNNNGYKLQEKFIRITVQNGTVNAVHDTTNETNLVTAETVVSGDAGVTYTITVSNSDPASGTASNIITLVP